MTRAVLSIGSNLEDRVEHLRSVYRAFAPSLVTASSIWSTPPWGGVAQGEYLNAVLVVDDPRSPIDLLRAGQCLEAAARRVRDVRWGPRTLDVDIVTCVVDGVEVASDDPVLTLPHPRAHERAFVLAPWLEVEPAAMLGGRRVDELLAGLPDDERTGPRRTDIPWGNR